MDKRAEYLAKLIKGEAKLSRNAVWGKQVGPLLPKGSKPLSRRWVIPAPKTKYHEIMAFADTIPDVIEF